MITKEENIKNMEIQLSSLHEKILHINPYDEAREYDHLTYKIEILKRDIQIEKLLLPAYQKLIYSTSSIIIQQQTTPNLEQLKNEIIVKLKIQFGEEFIHNPATCNFENTAKFANDINHDNHIYFGIYDNLLILSDNLSLDDTKLITTYFTLLEEE